MRCNIEEAKGKGFPLKINAVEVKVAEKSEAVAIGSREIDFVKSVLPNLDWPALVKVCSDTGRFHLWLKKYMLIRLVAFFFLAMKGRCRSGNKYIAANTDRITRGGSQFSKSYVPYFNECSFDKGHVDLSSYRERVSCDRRDSTYDFRGTGM